MNGTVMPNQAMHIVGGRMSASPSPGIKLIEGNWPVDQDADGVLEGTSTYRRIVVDLSEALGYRLGKQVSQTANFRVNYIRIGLRNVDDANDNDGTTYFAGTTEWYSPSKHRIDAVQAWRQLEKRLEEDDADDEGLFVATQDRYKGFRYGWTNQTDISYATAGAPSALPNGYALVDMVSIYNGGLNDGVPPQNNAIFDRKVGRSSKLGWSAMAQSREFIDQAGIENDPVDAARIQDYEWTAPAGHNIEVMGGLLIINVEHSNTDTVQNFDDDFDFQIDIGISGWSSW